MRLAAQVEAAFDGFPHPIRVAVMGCVVNGPGEAREADIGVAAGNGKGQIFARVKSSGQCRKARSSKRSSKKRSDSPTTHH